MADGTTISGQVRPKDQAQNQPQSTIINIYTGAAPQREAGYTLPTQAQINPVQLNDQQTLLQISQTLDNLTRKITSENGLIFSCAPSQGSTIKDTGFVDATANNSSPSPVDQNHESKHQATPHHFDWLHGFNLLYVFTILFTLLLPAASHTFLGTEIIQSTGASEELKIGKWDLLIAKQIPSTKIFVGDILALHNPMTGDHEVIKVKQVSKPVSKILSFTVSPSANQEVNHIYSVNANTNLYKVEKSVPNLGLVQAFLDSTYVKILTGLIVVLLNFVVHLKRKRKHNKTLLK